MKWFLKALKQYADFKSRAKRPEYWFFVLFVIIGTIISKVIDITTGMYDRDIAMGVIEALFTLAIIIPFISVTARRLHDIGRSGWWQLIGIIPIIGWIIMIMWTIKDSAEDENQYGKGPKNYKRSFFNTVLIDNDDWLVKVGPTGRFKITLKDRNLTRKVSKFEGHHFVEIIECMFKQQIIPFSLLDVMRATTPDFMIMVKNDKFKGVVEYFADATFNGGIRWQSFFESEPFDVAKMYE